MVGSKLGPPASGLPPEKVLETGQAQQPEPRGPGAPRTTEMEAQGNAGLGPQGSARSSVQRPIVVINLRKNAPRGLLPATKGRLWIGISNVF